MIQCENFAHGALLEEKKELHHLNTTLEEIFTFRWMSERSLDIIAFALLKRMQCIYV